MDHARSAHPGVQAALDRLSALGPGADVLGLDRITRLLARLGDPHHALPPVFHVAGTNGKGSTCAFLRAGLEAAGYRVHVYTSPHLVRFNERIRVAGTLIDDERLAALLGEVLDAGGDIGASFFEVTTAVAFLAFARTPADACVIEVGLGGRLDATNVLAAPAVCGIAQLGIDHQAFLGDTIEAIAAEKAGIAKPGVPLVTPAYAAPVAAIVANVAGMAGAPLHVEGRDWRWQPEGDGLAFDDGERLALPAPALAGAHQLANCALAAAMLRRQTMLAVPDDALAAMARDARWPARMQRLATGPLTAPLGTTREVWLDGGHNPAAAEALAPALARFGPKGVDLILGMLANKDPLGLLAPLAPSIASVTAIPVPDHASHSPDALTAVAQQLGLAAATASSIDAAVAHVAARGSAPAVLIAGSLYLAGEALARNDEPPA
ncbi:bifunctional folylpolyglutamate synthase/dihydrofolate synthase [Sphingomonas baiyangensis]|uniref:Dihydrofolate synthase/folylpolyglutamate synthase n=1 Tax=Sphingomonas baiyangensis TaxID=2572576 RepID=A0A4U1L3S4_9SPHN|nr:folylpolyglutamate synthase/dihydrofolate synthase family protein [Sphingomonas baiyangensis]TKD50785.1 bifunctional folylpolyglutamate synthase/dihydrofolate synthase [Sphingomonas baiyangensis]